MGGNGICVYIYYIVNAMKETTTDGIKSSTLVSRRPMVSKLPLWLSYWDTHDLLHALWRILSEVRDKGHNAQNPPPRPP